MLMVIQFRIRILLKLKEFMVIGNSTKFNFKMLKNYMINETFKTQISIIFAG
jgi:hypothetical protein